MIAVHVRSLWGTAHFLLPVAEYHRDLTEPVDTWDLSDPMDKLFYVCRHTHAR